MPAVLALSVSQSVPARWQTTFCVVVPLPTAAAAVLQSEAALPPSSVLHLHSTAVLCEEKIAFTANDEVLLNFFDAAREISIHFQFLKDFRVIISQLTQF